MLTEKNHQCSISNTIVYANFAIDCIKNFLDFVQKYKQWNWNIVFEMVII